MSRFPRPVVAAALIAASAALAQSAVAAPKITTLAKLEVRGQISARGTIVAITQVHGDASTLWVGKGGKLPVAINVAKAVPDWGQPHVGTDDRRRPVVVYPSCTDRAIVSTCDLRVYDVLSDTDAEVAGVNLPGVGESEGSMDRGAIAFTRWTSLVDPLPLGEGGYGSEQTTLVYRAFGHEARVLTDRGGQQIHLNRGRIAQVRDTDPTAGLCGNSAVEVVRVDGHARKTLAQHGCGLDDQTIISPTFIGDEVLWGFRSVGGSTVERAPAAGGTVESAKVKAGFATISPTAHSAAKYIDGDYYSAPGSAEDASGIWELRRISALEFQ